MRPNGKRLVREVYHLKRMKDKEMLTAMFQVRPLKRGLKNDLF